ncbi:MAG TPA: periplasmic heavy metal sensor [Candidatus Berkiella sp.]|nr:periplasmic heavy metal sensor [Candidatus Berkiella sp.]
MNQNKWLILVLCLSVASNIFIVGYFIGHQPQAAVEPVNTAALTQEMKGIYKTLPEENQKKLSDFMKEQQQEIIINQNQIRQIRLQIAQVLAQEPLNEKLLGNLFEQTYQLSIKNFALAQKTTFQIMLKLPQQERIKVAKALAASALRKPNTTKKVTPPEDKTS